jgi:Cu(I)/Ag(I) efflux system membrane protein CusA/SilA
MKRIAAPMIGGILTSFLLELIVYPPLYEIWLGRRNSHKESELVSSLPDVEPILATAKKAVSVPTSWSPS